MKYVIFDIDNCLADDAHRIPLINWAASNPTERYGAYHDACHLDQPGNVDLFHEQTWKCGVTPLFFTARPESVRAKTRDWLCKHFEFNAEPRLFMRDNADNRPSKEVKLDMLMTFIHSQHDGEECILCAYDDKDDVLRMYVSQDVNAVKLKIHDVCAYTDPRIHEMDPVPVRELDDLCANVNAIVASQSELDDLCAAEALRGYVGLGRGKPHLAPKPEVIAADVLTDMAATFRERNAVYGSNFKMVGKLMAVLFPQGVSAEVLHSDQFHLFELKLVKLSRFAISNLQHMDSIHDDGVYSAMIEAILVNKENGQ